MRTSHSCAALLALLVNGAAFAAQPLPLPLPLPAEQFTIETLPPKSPHWVYVVDEAFANEIDARVRLFDGDSYRHLGQIDAGFNPGVVLSPDRAITAVATTYFARGGHGARTDVVEFVDNATLSTLGEIVLPPKHAQLSPAFALVSYSSDGRFVYVSYITPAASFGVLDPASRTVLNEIDTAGCVLVLASGPNRVSSLCDSGRLLTVTLDEQGHEASRALSEIFYDVDSDPIFAQGIPTSSGYLFLSFLGQVHEVDLTGPQPIIRAPWSIVSAAERGRWRPGGQQVAAIHSALGRLYVPMHAGGEGSHKQGGSQIWVIDLKTHHRIARWPMKPLRLSPISAVQVSQDASPVLFAGTDGHEVAVIDALTGHLRHIEANLGQSPWMLLNP